MPGSDDRAIAVTGLGATSPLGGDVQTTWDALLAGNSGARPIGEIWTERYPTLPVTFACSLAQPAAETLTPLEIRRLARWGL